MTKKDLYRSIDNIKQDGNLKENILKAVKDKDEVTIVRRNFLVPAMITVLLCLNIGMIAKLVIFNKSQVNMSEFKAKTSISKSAEKDMSRIENDMRQLEQEKNNVENAQKQLEFGNEIQKFIEETSDGSYFVIEQRDFDYELENTPAAYLDNYYKPVSSWENSLKYQRFVQTINLSKYSGEVDSYAFTDHEYIVEYDGNGYNDENIVGITESNVDNSMINSQILTAAASVTEDDIANAINSITISGYNNYEKKYNINGLYYLFKSDEAFLDCDIYNDETDTYYKYYLFITPDGINIKDSIPEYTGDVYWNHTIYKPSLSYDSGNSNMTKVPDVIGMDLKEAKKILKEAGLTVISVTYTTYSIDNFINEVVNVSPPPGKWVGKNSSVSIELNGTVIEIN